MFMIATLTLELRIEGAHSLKDKRQFLHGQEGQVANLVTASPRSH